MIRLFELTQNALFVLILLIAAPLFGGVGKVPVFVTQALTVAAFWAYASRILLGLPLEPRDRLYRSNRLPFALFGAFLIYVFLQERLGPLIFRIGLGTLSVSRTEDYVRQLFCYTLIFFLALDFMTKPRRLLWLAPLLAAQIIFLVCLGFYQSFSEMTPIRKFYNAVDPTNVQILFSSFPNANHFGAYIYLAAMMLLAYVLSFWRTFKPPFRWDAYSVLMAASLIVFVVAGWSIRSAGARAVFIAYGLSVIIPPFFVFRHFERKIWFILVALTIASVAVLTLSSKPTYLYDKWSTIGGALSIRLSIYREMMGIFFDFPLGGVGLGAVKYITSLYQLNQVEHFTWAHLFNHHLELLSETGIVGYGLFVGSVGGITVHALGRCLAEKSLERKIFGVASFWTLLMMAGLSMIDEYMLTPSVAMVTILHLAILARCAWPAKEEIVVMSNQSRRNDRWKLVLPLTAVITIVILPHAIRDGWAGAHIKPGDCDTQKLAGVVKVCPQDSEYLLMLGDACTKAGQGRYQWAYEEAVRQTPTWSRAWLLWGRSLVLRGEDREGIEALEQAVDLMPYNRDNYLYLTIVCLRLAREASNNSEKEYYLRKARLWVEASRICRRPLSPTDFEFLTMHGPRQPLSDEDRQAYLKLFD